MSVLGLDEAKRIIANSSAGTTRPDDADVQSDIDTAERQISVVVGPLSPTVVTVRATAGCLPIGPFVGPITAASVDGVPVSSLAGLRVDDFGVVRGLPSGVASLTYTAGWVDLPADLAKAIREQFRHVWSFRRGNSRSTDAERGAGHAMPWRVSELIEPYRWGWGFA